MIIRKRHSWFRMLFVWHGSVLPILLPRLASVFALSVLIVWFHKRIFILDIPLSPVPFSLAGVSLAIFLGFRNTAGYDRFWEARKLWGALLNDSRNFIRQASTNTSLPPDDARIHDARDLTIALLHLLKHQLRGTDPGAEIERLLQADKAVLLKPKKYKAAFTLRLLGEWVRQRRIEGQLTDGALYGIDASLMKISDSIGGCERIASTPIPYPYTVLLHRTVYLYCFFLPFGLVDSIGWATPFFSAFIAYTLMALDEVVNQIEEPFGNDDHDLALNAIVEMIENSVLEMAGGVERPCAGILPVHYRLT